MADVVTVVVEFFSVSWAIVSKPVTTPKNKFNHMCQKFGLHSDSHYDCEAICENNDGLNTNCMASHATFPSLIALWETIVCPKDLHLEWHSQDCVFGKIQDCAMENWALWPIEKEGTSNALVH